jgi:uncharacterized protein
MKKHIMEVLQAIEREYDVKVLYACESGSRAWGFPSKDSDYDVRFLYVHKKEWYLSIDKGRDVLEVPSPDAISIPVDPLLDMSGWEITKALRLYRKSNPPFFEWLHASIVYYEKCSTVERLLRFEPHVFSPVTSLYHYVSMAKRNFRAYLLKEQVDHKKYFTVLRPILAGKWMVAFHTVPPVEFQVLVEAMVPEGEIKVTISRLISKKKERNEQKLEPKIDVLHEYAHNEIIQLEKVAKETTFMQTDQTESLNDLFRELLDEAWNE